MAAKKTIWQKLGEALGIISNVDGQPRHPTKGHYQGMPHTAAAKGFVDGKHDDSAVADGRQVAELDNEEEDEIGGEEDDHQNPKSGPEELKEATNNSQGDTDMAFNRKEVVTFLVTNCDCWKGDEATLNKFTDEKLAKLLANAHVVEAVKKNFGSELTVNAMPAALAKFHAKKGGDEVDPEDEEEEDDMEENAGGNQAQASGGGKGVQVGGKGVKEEYNTNKRRPITERLSPEEQQVWNHATRIVNNAKKALVDRLVANARDDTQRKRLTINFMKKQIEELEDLVSLLPPVVNSDFLGYAGESEEPVANYMGAGGGPGTTTNQQDDPDDILALPVINYQQWAKEDSQRKQA